MALILEPLADTQLILGGSEETGLLSGVLAALYFTVNACCQSSRLYHLRHRGP
jgi:hypothetical protein